MKLQKLVTLVAAVMFLAMTSLAFAADTQISVGFNSQPIPYASGLPNCNKGGDLSFTYKAGATILVTPTAADSYTMDLDLGSSLCKDVGLWYKLDNTTFDGQVVSGENVETNGTLFMRVFGNKGQRRVQVSFYANSTEGWANATVGAAETDFLKYNIFNQAVAPNVLKAGGAGIILSDGTVNGTAFDNLPNATVADNTLCVEHDPAIIAENQKIHFNLNRGTASPTVFEFIGGMGAQPQIAHFISLTYGKANCKSVPQHIECGKLGTEQGATDSCSPFDYETRSGYCYESKWKDSLMSNKAIIAANPGFEAHTDYRVELEILVNGQKGNNGVYFNSNQGIGARAMASRDELCKVTNATTQVAGERWFKHGDTVGVDVNSWPTDKAGCSVPEGRQFTKMVTATSNLDIVAGDTHLWIDLPSFRYDKSKISAGDLVSVKVTVKRDPCVTLGEFTYDIGTMCCEAKEAAGNELTFPYFTQMGGDNWWDGIAITNLSGQAGAVVLTFYESDGDSGSYTTPVIEPRSMFVNTLENILPGITKVAGAGALGDARVWIRAEAANNMDIDGFAMIAEPSTGESMGYLPRRDGY